LRGSPLSLSHLLQERPLPLSLPLSLPPWLSRLLPQPLSLHPESVPGFSDSQGVLPQDRSFLSYPSHQRFRPHPNRRHKVDTPFPS
jgi:hypothetical protein